MAHLLGAEALHLEVPARIIFDSVTIGVAEGDRIGIVGRNGDGKSSLLMMLAGRREPDSGQVTSRGGTRIGVLEQSDSFPEGETVGHAIVGEAPEHEWAGVARVRDVIAGLVGDLPWDGLVADLSGGQQRRVALARLLASDWDILALDEPTNHLDVEAIAWLAGHLKRRWPANQGALMVVTHDRWFLDEVCNTTWEVHDRIVEPFEGGYAAYILQRVERDRQAAVVEQKRQNLARKELAWLRRGAPARTSKPKFRIDAANELIADVPEIRDRVSLQSMAVARLGKEVVNLLDASVSFGDAETGTEREVLHEVEWRLAPGERTGILGRNGAGKSTLLGLIDGTLQPTSGTVKRGKTVQVAMLTQRIDELEEHWNDPVRVVIDGLRTSFTVGSGSKAQDLTPGQMLERMGFTNAQLSTQVKDLSGGQQRRLQLLLILLGQPNVLILDEPTNDLDTDMLAALEDLLDSWPGTLIVVSHDRYFLERVTDQQYAVLHGRLRHLPGGVDEYLKLRAAEAAGAGPGSAPAATTGSGTASTAGSATPMAPATPALAGAERRTAEKELQSIERRLAKIESEVAAVHARMAAHDQSDYAGLGAIGDELSALESEAAEREERWLELSELLE
ncbi:ABC transporter ATP-binding protein [Leucobacter sp. OLJS4]|uniref:ABC-F family ATP-binding cassette domain-containing protein n=1 Tax=unclassified Leucobacter TaxID=2621730 RepID=UPI000C18B5E6|nr:MULTISPECIES: ABC-F family ATP-binding cassette domain-containing protein [unclassified Leucobacter]PII83209.1 ABC transporter ATP-binding protein [Leucobacter sp. OLCALW19]PII86760.1 ABC transporter ATP-binding protein [Leucobacter sp. OLTLW20]PII91304.1 ABC transporter ATP-binding protein [Leucobacter sp. OLAS13]PII98764.1 ABC transporter ATP-binding protein [Leucobacter sp. OLDS2]PIJ03922.1 ABC transporter ATP-binding protein [Leucobacter sp. OLIS6]